MAIDLGEKRTGLAMGDRETGLVSALEVIECAIDADAGKMLLERLARAIENHLGDSAGTLVMGLPLNMDGSEGAQAKKARTFGELLAARTSRAVVYHDERLTSVEADWSMARTGMTRGQKKEKRDALAAAAILRDYFGSLRGESAGSDGGVSDSPDVGEDS
ncbi:MAG: Holliday junction resolvase RuvX [Phycisphaeraceae bacterium]|nr:Holliday junction resolvase RuvX [Phycisphaeraceae bacterium]